MTPLGPPHPRILILADWPEQFDLMKNEPLATYNRELGAMLGAAGLTLGECLVSVVSTRPAPTLKGKEDLSKWISHTKSPKEDCRTSLHGSWVSAEVSNDIARTTDLINLAKPNIIIALGNLATFALTGRVGVKKWRGSQLRLSIGEHSCTVVPTYHPRTVRRDYSVRAITVQDLRRVARIASRADDLRPEYQFVIRPSFLQARDLLRDLLGKLNAGVLRLSIDIETRAGHMACIAFATSKRHAFCIPLMSRANPQGYWNEVEEYLLVRLMVEVMEHSNARCFGQNFLYDIQYIWRFWFCIPRTDYDTMNAQHTLFPGQPKSLDYIASMYCEYYVYWKELVSEGMKTTKADE